MAAHPQHSPRRRSVLSSYAPRLWWLPAILGATASAALDAVGEAPIDLPMFVAGSHQLLSGGWAETFSNSALQVGPLFLLALAPCRALGAVVGVSPLAVASFVIQIGLVALLMAVVGRVLAGRPHRRLAQCLSGIAVLSTGIVHGAYADGHPAQLAIPLLWVLAALSAKEGREARAGLLIGLSAGLELWGVLGAPLLLLGRPRRAVAGLLLEGLLVAAMLGPFVLFGDFRMFEYQWLVGGGTLVTLFVDRGDRFSWPMRLVQAAAASGVGAVLAWRLRGSVHAVWAAPLTIVGVRIAFDPSLNTWYLEGFVTLAIVGAAAVLAGERLPAMWRQARARRLAAPS